MSMSNLKEIKELMSTCIEIGLLRAQVAISPSSDKIRKKNAEALLARNGLPKMLLKRWVGEGLVVESKGEKNSPITYSLTQIMETIGAVKCKDCIV